MVDLPSFYRRNDIDEFLDWEMKVDQIFASHHIEEERKVFMATHSFQGIAWTTLMKDPKVQIGYWNE